MDRTRRLFALVEHLRARRTGVTAEDLAARFGVSVRTMYRDLDAVREGVVPIQAEPGPGGGYRIDASYTLPPLVLQPREAALLLAVLRWASEARIVPFRETLAALVDKITVLLPKPLRAEVAARADELHFAFVPTLPIRDDVRRALEEAWFLRAPLAVEYETGSGERRHFEGPLVRLVADRQAIRVHLALEGGEERGLRGDRIVRATVLRER